MERITKLQEYLKKQAAACGQIETGLKQDGRFDESNFEKIRANVYGIFAAVAEAAKKQETAGEAVAFLRRKLEEIPANWQKALELALQHDVADAAAIERIKLDAAEGIRAELAKQEG